MRLSSRVGGVTLEKTAEGWQVPGGHGCAVGEHRISELFDNLARLAELPTEERPESGDSFQVRVVARAGNDPVYWLDVAGKRGESDLVQLHGGARRLVRGLDRALLESRRSVWCPGQPD